MRAWTLGYPPAYEHAIRVPGNAKAPGGYLFPTHEAAVEHTRTHLDAARYEPFEVELPRPYAECVTRTAEVAAQARHDWHRDRGRWVMPECGVCEPRVLEALRGIDHDVLVVSAPLINPDTGQPA